jgi:dihydroorotate dehydrogenase (NAD+) catalytic subunit
MIELAPQHKFGLALKLPLMPASGHAGYGAEHHALIDWERWGAFVTNAVTARTRRSGWERRMFDLQTALLIEHSSAYPGVDGVIREHAEVWKHLGAPVIVHVAGITPDDVAECVVRLAIVDGVGGVELSFSEAEDEGAVGALISAAREIDGPPLLAQVPMRRAAHFAPICVEAGADALVVGAPPIGVMPSGSDWVSGYMYGRAMLPLVVRAVRETLERVDAPIIAAGGVHAREDVDTLLQAGARAVQIDTLVWRDPNAAMAIAESFAE